MSQCSCPTLSLFNSVCNTNYWVHATASGQDSCTYDTFMPGPAPGLDELIKLQEQVKKGSLSVDEALERFSDWQRVQRGLDGIQQVTTHFKFALMLISKQINSFIDNII